MDKESAVRMCKAWADTVATRISHRKKRDMMTKCDITVYCSQLNYSLFRIYWLYSLLYKSRFRYYILISLNNRHTKMPIPIIKVGFTVVRLFSRPFVTVLSRRLNNDPSKAERTFFKWFGIKCYQFENTLDRMLTQ